jgi:two-component sensor histidine kinase
VWDIKRLRLATDAAGVGLWSWNIGTDEISLDERSHALWGAPRGNPITFRELSKRIHPDDLNRVGRAFEATRTMVGLYEIDFRIMLESERIKWISARGHGDDETVGGGVTLGVFLDVTERKQAEEIREMHAGEMSHRIKNLFSIASALTSIAARSAATTTEMANDLKQRLGALGRAHDLIRPISGQYETKGALIGSLLAVLLAPYDDKGNGDGSGGRVRVSVPEVPVGETSATTMALVVHELATNSIKYGALSSPDGHLDVTCAHNDGELVLVWWERGGPPVTATVNKEGFGSRLVGQSVSGQLGGSMAIDWAPGGVIVTLRLDKERLAR